MKRILAVLVPLCVHGQVDPDRLLREARARIVENVSNLPKYTCVQTIRRSRFELFYAGRGNHCNDRPPAGRGPNQPQLLLAWTDQFKLDVTVSGGTEIFSWAGAREFQSGDAQEIVGGGLTGSGDFGPFLTDIFGSDAVSRRYVGMEAESGWTLAAYQYQMPASASQYQLKAGSRPQDVVTLAYEGQFWIDPQTAELRKLTITVPKPPARTDTCRIETEIEYRPVAVSAASLLLPSTTLLKLWDADGSRSENRIGYASCRAFQSESVFRPEAEGSPAGSVSAAPAARAPVVIPGGLSVRIALRTPIDMEGAFGGDAVEAQLAEDLRAPVIGVVAPRGTVVHGRIVRAERHFRPSSYFALGLRFDSLSLGGVEVPVALERAPRSPEEQMVTATLPRAQGIGMFVFHGDLRVLDEGFLSDWKTAARRPTP